MSPCGAGQGWLAPGRDHPCPTAGPALFQGQHPSHRSPPIGTLHCRAFGEDDPAGGHQAARSPSHAALAAGTGVRLAQRRGAVAHLPRAAVPSPGMEKGLSSSGVTSFPQHRGRQSRGQTWGEPSTSPATQIKNKSIKTFKAGSWQEPNPENSPRKLSALPWFPEQTFPALAGTGNCIPRSWEPSRGQLPRGHLKPCHCGLHSPENKTPGSQA